jgi:hypothetical protein
VADPAAEDLNVLYDAALEFGENWRRPVDELAAERLPHLDEDDRAVLVGLVTACRQQVETHIEEVYAVHGDDWPSDVEPAVREWILDRFPWMTEANLSHAISQGVYYAWHG